MSPGPARVGSCGVQKRDNAPYSALSTVFVQLLLLFSLLSLVAGQGRAEVTRRCPRNDDFGPTPLVCQKKIFPVRCPVMQERTETDRADAAIRPLDPLAELMLLDTRPQYPMGFFIECGCVGSLDRERLREALNAVAGRHPNAASHVVWRAGRPFWKSTTTPPAFLWDPQAARVDPWRPFDLSRETGLRLIVFPTRSQGESPEAWKLVLFGHHAVCDGLAACTARMSLSAIRRNLAF